MLDSCIYHTQTAVMFNRSLLALVHAAVSDPDAVLLDVLRRTLPAEEQQRPAVATGARPCPGIECERVECVGGDVTRKNPELSVRAQAIL